MLVFIERDCVQKAGGFVIWYDLLMDDETGEEYFHINGNLTHRVK